MKHYVKPSWEDGANAYWQGLGLDANPFRNGTEEHKSWNTAWRNSSEHDKSSFDLGWAGHHDNFHEFKSVQP